jgi:hypothetical protein
VAFVLLSSKRELLAGIDAPAEDVTFVSADSVHCPYTGRRLARAVVVLRFERTPRQLWLDPTGARLLLMVDATLPSVKKRIREEPEMKVNKRKPALWAALLSAAALTSVISGCAGRGPSGSPLAGAKTEDVSGLFPVDFGTRIAWYGKFHNTRITGQIHNNSGHAADHLRLVIDELDWKGHVITRVYRSVAAIPAGGRTAFEAEVRAAPSYRVYVEHFEAAQTPQAP